MAHITRRPGFTLIELLTVIGVILFLLAFLCSAAVYAWQRARIQAAQTLVQRIAGALEQYKAELKALPPDTGYGLPTESGNAGVTYDPGSLYYYLGVQIVDAKGRTFGPYTSFSDDQLGIYNDPLLGKRVYVKDPWGSRIGFVGDARRTRGVYVFSAGPDKKTACDDGVDNGNSYNAPNYAYDGVDNDGDGIADNASELGEAGLNGRLTGTKKNKMPDEVLDDINNQDPQ